MIFFIAAAAELPSKLYWTQVIKMTFNSLSTHSDRQPGRGVEAIGSLFPAPFQNTHTHSPFLNFLQISRTQITENGLFPLPINPCPLVSGIHS